MPERDASGVLCHGCGEPMTITSPGSVLTHICMTPHCRGAFDWDGYEVWWAGPPDTRDEESGEPGMPARYPDEPNQESHPRHH